MEWELIKRHEHRGFGRSQPSNTVSITSMKIAFGSEFHQKFIGKFVEIYMNEEKGLLILKPYNEHTEDRFKVSYNPKRKQSSPDTHPYITPTVFLKENQELRGTFNAVWNEEEQALVVIILSQSMISDLKHSKLGITIKQ